MKSRWLTLALALVAATALAQAPPQAEANAVPIGDPQPGKLLRDRDFGVSTRQFGLDRRVEMYQWRVSSDGYERVWNTAPIYSSHFAPGHDNPSAVPLDNLRWWSETATLDGKPIERAVLQALGEWRLFRPNFSRLPANLAATFQPEGDGLGSAENPLDPQIGDLRISWRSLHLPVLAEQVELRDGVWRLSPRAATPAREADATSAPVAPPSRQGWWWALAGVLVLAWWLQRRRRTRAAG